VGQTDPCWRKGLEVLLVLWGVGEYEVADALREPGIVG
jgi:hypothetical protein